MVLFQDNIETVFIGADGSDDIHIWLSSSNLSFESYASRGPALFGFENERGGLDEFIFLIRHFLVLLLTHLSA